MMYVVVSDQLSDLQDAPEPPVTNISSSDEFDDDENRYVGWGVGGLAQKIRSFA